MSDISERHEVATDKSKATDSTFRLTIPQYLLNLPYSKLPSVITGPLAQSIQAASDLFKSRLAEVWTNPSQFLLYNHDCERDDYERLWVLVPEWKAQPLSSRPGLAIVGSEHVGGIDTFPGLVKATAKLLGWVLGTGGMTAEEDAAGVAVRDGIFLLRGTKLEPNPDNPDHVSDAKAAADRVVSVLGGRPYVWHNNTSEALFVSLPPETQAQCLAHQQTCADIYAPLKPVLGANTRFDALSNARAISVCEEFGIPMGFLHPSTVGSGFMSLSQLPGYETVLSQPSDDPDVERGEMKFAKKKSIQWTGQLWGGLAGRWASEVSEAIGKLIKKHTDAAIDDSSLDPEAREAMRGWEEYTTDPKMYPGRFCSLMASGQRAVNVAHNMWCLLNNAFGDTVGIITDTPSIPTDLKYWPLRVDYGTEGKEPTLTLDETMGGKGGWKPSVAVMSDEMADKALLDRYGAHPPHQDVCVDSSAGFDTAPQIAAVKVSEEVRKTDESTRIVNRQFAQEWGVFSKVMKDLLSMTSVAADGYEPKEHERKMFEEVKTQMKAAEKNLEGATMHQLCRERQDVEK